MMNRYTKILMLFTQIFILLISSIALPKKNYYRIRLLKKEERQRISPLFKGRSISQQSFRVDFPNFKNVLFVSVDDDSRGPNTCAFYLIRQNRIIYTFPAIKDVESYHSEIKVISFRDMNLDGYRDVTIILEYMTGVGPTGSVPFAAATVFFNNKKDGFYIDDSIDSKIKDFKSISEIQSFIKKRFKK